VTVIFVTQPEVTTHSQLGGLKLEISLVAIVVNMLVLLLLYVYTVQETVVPRYLWRWQVAVMASVPRCLATRLSPSSTAHRCLLTGQHRTSGRL